MDSKLVTICDWLEAFPVDLAVSLATVLMKVLVATNSLRLSCRGVGGGSMMTGVTSLLMWGNTLG